MKNLGRSLWFVVVAGSMSLAGCPEETDPPVTLPDAVASEVFEDASGGDPRGFDGVADGVQAEVDAEVSADVPADVAEVDAATDTSDATEDAAPETLQEVDGGPADTGDDTPDDTVADANDVPDDTGDDVPDDAVPDGVAETFDDVDSADAEAEVTDVGAEIDQDAAQETDGDTEADTETDIAPVCEGPGAFNEDGVLQDFDTDSGPIYAVQYIPEETHDLVAVDFFTVTSSAPADAKVALFADDSGLPQQGAPLAFGFLTATDQEAWATAVMDQTVTLQAGTTYWVTFEAQSLIELPWAETSATTEDLTYVWSFAGNYVDTGSGPYFAQPWMVRFKDCE